MDIRRIVIAGAGTMGLSMAQIYAEHFDDVTLYNHREESLKRAEDKIKSNVETLLALKSINEEKADKILSSIKYTTSTDCFKDCDFISENLKEDLAVKDEFYKTISDIVKPNAIISTNTSGLSINRLAENVKNKDRFIGMHFFNPPHLVPLVEIIKGDETRDDIAKAIYELSLKIGKKPVIVNKDVPGFAANRLQFAILREALELVEKGVVSAEGIDDVMKYGLGFRYACLGPLEVADFGGLDTFYHISEYLMKDLANGSEPPALLKEHFEKGEYGVKSGKGFFDYSGDRAKAATEARDEKYLDVYNALYNKK